jgi:hypothetical protein
MFAEAFERGICGFVASFKRGLRDLVTRYGCVGYAAPVILGPETSAQSNHVAHTLLPFLSGHAVHAPSHASRSRRLPLLMTQRASGFRS